jgi:hypothetical protein
LILGLLAPSAGVGRSPRLALDDVSRPGVLLIEPRISLPPVTLAELLPAGRSAVCLGQWSGGQPIRDDGGARTRIVRRLPAVWRMRLARGQEPDRLDVQYQIDALGGQPGRLVSTESPESEVRVELRPIPPLVVSDDAEGTVLEGGVVLYMDLEAVRSAGRYSGMLTVTLTRP